MDKGEAIQKIKALNLLLRHQLQRKLQLIELEMESRCTYSTHEAFSTWVLNCANVKCCVRLPFGLWGLCNATHWSSGRDEHWGKCGWPGWGKECVCVFVCVLCVPLGASVLSRDWEWVSMLGCYEEVVWGITPFPSQTEGWGECECVRVRESEFRMLWGTERANVEASVNVSGWGSLGCCVGAM